MRSATSVSINRSLVRLLGTCYPPLPARKNRPISPTATIIAPFSGVTLVRSARVTVAVWSASVAPMCVSVSPSLCMRSLLYGLGDVPSFLLHVTDHPRQAARPLALLQLIHCCQRLGEEEVVALQRVLGLAVHQESGCRVTPQVDLLDGLLHLTIQPHGGEKVILPGRR